MLNNDRELSAPVILSLLGVVGAWLAVNHISKAKRAKQIESKVESTKGKIEISLPDSYLALAIAKKNPSYSRQPIVHDINRARTRSKEPNKAMGTVVIDVLGGGGIKVKTPILESTHNFIKSLGREEGANNLRMATAFALESLDLRRLLNTTIKANAAFTLEQVFKYWTSPIGAKGAELFNKRLKDAGIKASPITEDFIPVESELYVKLAVKGKDILDIDTSSPEKCARDLAIIDLFYPSSAASGSTDPNDISAPPALRMAKGLIELPAPFRKSNLNTSKSTISVSNSVDKIKIKDVPEKGVEKLFSFAGLLQIREQVFILSNVYEKWNSISTLSKEELTDPVALAMYATYKSLTYLCPAIGAALAFGKSILEKAVFWKKTQYNLMCAGDKTKRSRKEKIKDYRDVNRTSSYTKSACGCSKLAGDAEWVEKGYRPYFVEDNLAKNWVNWWVYNPRYNWGDTPEIEALKSRRKKYGPKGP